MIDFTIRLGDILTAATIAIGGLWVGYSFWFKLEHLDQRQRGMEEELKKQTTILIDLAETRTRMTAFEQRLNELVSRFNNIH